MPAPVSTLPARDVEWVGESSNWHMQESKCCSCKCAKHFFQQPIAIEDKLYCGQKVPDPFQHICPEGVYILILGWGSSISFHAMTCSGKAPELSQERVYFLARQGCCACESNSLFKQFMRGEASLCHMQHQAACVASKHMEGYQGRKTNLVRVLRKCCTAKTFAQQVTLSWQKRATVLQISQPNQVSAALIARHGQFQFAGGETFSNGSCEWQSLE